MVFDTFNAWDDVRTWRNVASGNEVTCAGKELPKPAQYIDKETKAVFYFDNPNVARFSGYGTE